MPSAAMLGQLESTEGRISISDPPFSHVSVAHSSRHCSKGAYDLHKLKTPLCAL